MNVQKQDLEIAKLKLLEGDLSLVIVKNGKVIFETNKQGIIGFLQAIEKFNKNLSAASAADKIVGVAAAMLCVYLRLDFVFALTISEGGIRLLEKHNIHYIFKNKVSHILNRDKNAICPFEKTAMASKNTVDAYYKLKSLANSMIEKSIETP
jgi:hypothetical protein